jgi:hypothetical protein
MGNSKKMQKKIFTLLIIFQSVIVIAQTKEQKKIDKYIASNNIILNNPTTPTGFDRYTDCKGRPIYRKDSAETIIIYTWGGSVAEDLERFKNIINSETFNIHSYPSKTQSNGTVIINRMSKHIFVWRDKELYLLDSFNEKSSQAELKLMDDFFANKISKENYEKKLQELNDSIFPNTPQFKLIYFEGMFDTSYFYEFSEEQNFRKEYVKLMANWEDSGVEFFEINLKTHTNGRYRFSKDMKVLERTNCK